MTDKTCKTCRHWLHYANVRGMCVPPQLEIVYGNATTAITRETDVCSTYQPRTDTSDYDKLAEVARDMLLRIGCNCSEQLCAGCKMLMVGDKCDAVRIFKEKLEECGVTLDD